jgi:peptide/nickel transport system substrate-binding protein
MEENMSGRKLTRREFLKVSTIGLIGAAATALGELEPSAASNLTRVKEPAWQTPGEIASAGSRAGALLAYKEAPMLKARVAAGTLPPIDQRLPVNPLVVSGGIEIGDYGGEIRTIHKDPIWFTSNYDLNSDRILQFSDQDLRTIEANIIESWEVSADAREWTFHMRNGMKWSDGSNFTSEDIRFWWEDVLNNVELTTNIPWQFRFGGANMVVDIINVDTFKFTFEAAFGNFAAHLTRWHPFTSVLLPSAYMKQFHVDYADPTILAQLIAQYGFETWVELFNYMKQWGAGIWYATENCTEIPVLGPWHIVENPEDGLYLWERNPYYWKVDQASNQLPYIDTLRYELISNDNEVKLKLIQGEIDLLGQHDVSIADYPFYQANQSAGNYVIADCLSCMSDRYVLFPQHYIAGDAVLTDIVNHPNFVKALSLAINRQAVNQLLFYNLASVGQMSVMPNSKYYKASYGTAWAQYDIPQANQLLDDMGLDERDGEGWRLRSDGQRLTFTIEHAGERVGLACQDYIDMVVSFWRAVGIDATSIMEDDGTYSQHMNDYQVHCGVWSADRCTDMLWPVQPQWFIPTADGGQGTACSAWVAWYNAADRSDPNLIVPPAAIQTLYGYFDQMTATGDEDERVQYGQQILDWLEDNPLEIGLILECPAPLLFNKYLRNLPPSKAPVGWDTYGLSTYHPETLYYEYPKVYLPLIQR